MTSATEFVLPNTTHALLEGIIKDEKNWIPRVRELAKRVLTLVPKRSLSPERAAALAVEFGTLNKGHTDYSAVEAALLVGYMITCLET